MCEIWVNIIEFRSNVKMSVTFCRTEVLIRTHTHTHTSYYIRMSDKPANGVNNNQNCSNRHLSEMAIGWSISSFLLKFNYMYANPSEMITCEWRANIWWISFKVSQIQIQYHIHTHTRSGWSNANDKHATRQCSAPSPLHIAQLKSY